MNSENTRQLTILLEVTLDFVNVLRAMEGKPEIKLAYGLSDNSDAIQGAFENIGASVLNDKVHASRNVGKATLAVPPLPWSLNSEE